MNWLTILQYAIEYGPAVKSIIDEAVTNEDISTKIRNLSAPFAGILEQVGREFFPQAAPVIHIAAVAMAAFDPSVTKWVQGALNSLMTPSPGLVVDGKYGPKTKAAVAQLQTQLGLTVDGVAGQLTQAAIAAALAKLH